MIRRFPTAIAATVAITVGLLASSSLAGAEGGGNNIVIVNNTVDAATAARSQLAVSYDPGDTVANKNIASATSRDCSYCRTVAVAMQVVIVEGQPTDFEPANAAAASNGNCFSCQTYAFAFQYVVQPGRIVYLGGAAQRQIQGIRARVDAVTASSLSYDDMKAQLEPLFAELVRVVTDNLHSLGASTTGHTAEATKAA